MVEVLTLVDGDGGRRGASRTRVAGIALPSGHTGKGGRGARFEGLPPQREGGRLTRSRRTPVTRVRQSRGPDRASRGWKLEQVLPENQALWPVLQAVGSEGTGKVLPGAREAGAEEVAGVGAPSGVPWLPRAGFPHPESEGGDSTSPVGLCP